MAVSWRPSQLDPPRPDSAPTGHANRHQAVQSSCRRKDMRDHAATQRDAHRKIGDSRDASDGPHDVFVRNLRMLVDTLPPSLILASSTDAYGLSDYSKGLGIPVKVFPSTMGQRLGDAHECQAEYGGKPSSCAPSSWVRQQAWALRLAFPAYPDGFNWRLQKGKKLTSVEAEDPVSALHCSRALQARDSFPRSSTIAAIGTSWQTTPSLG